MSWIARISPDAASPELKKLYDRIRAHATSQRVSHIWQVWGGHPAGMEAWFNHLRVLMDEPTPLTTTQAELIAVVVSATNGCAYCVAHHGPRLARLAGELIAHEVARDYRTANLKARDRVLLDAAVALTCEPSERKREDVDRLREYGYDDLGILKAVELTAYYNGVTRLVLGLGIELERGIEPWEFGSQK
jgi:uncharacterized peroxidase-related enzyme